MLQATLRRPSASLSADTLVDRRSPLAPPATPASNLARLSSEVAHDLNNFLTIIRGNCQLLQTTPNEKFAQDLLVEISKAGEQAALLTHQLDALSNSQSLPSHVQDLNLLLADCQGMLRTLLGGRQELVVNPQPAPCPVRLVPGQLERVLVNLSVNARDAMSEGGTLTISTTRFELRPGMPQTSVLSPGSYVLLLIADTGAGIDERVKARLFQPYQTTKPGGKGLGLAIVHSLVQQHHGHIDVHSQPGQGTSFHIYLPIAAQSAGGAADMPCLDDPDDNSRTVLLVEDESMVRSIFRRILQENGYFVLEAATGAEALFLAEQFSYPIDLLVTDIAMPKMNGLELSRKLAALHPETRTLFLSGYLEGALPGGKAPDKSCAFLQKPFKTHTLVQKVREVMEMARSA